MNPFKLSILWILGSNVPLGAAASELPLPALNIRPISPDGEDRIFKAIKGTTVWLNAERAEAYVSSHKEAKQYSLKVVQDLMMRRQELENPCLTSQQQPVQSSHMSKKLCYEAVGNFTDASAVCETKTITFENFLNKCVRVDGLLPNQLYSFKLYLVDNNNKTIGETFSRGTFCSGFDRPSFPPKASKESFVVENNSISLVWKPLPAIFSPISGTNNGIICFKYTASTNSRIMRGAIINEIIPVNQDRYSIKSWNQTSAMECRLSSINKFGESLYYSKIVIPAASNILKPAKEFLFQELYIDSTNFLFRWTNFSQASSSLAIHKLHTCAYDEAETESDLYKDSCRLIQTVLVQGNETRVFFGSNSPKGRLFRFGMSYSLYDNSILIQTSGIIWNQCNQVIEPTIINTLNMVDGYTYHVGDTSITLNRYPMICSGVSLFLSGYQIDCCELEIDHSLLINSRQHIFDPKSIINHESFVNCQMIDIDPRYFGAKTIENLEQNTLYSIRAKYTSNHDNTTRLVTRNIVKTDQSHESISLKLLFNLTLIGILLFLIIYMPTRMIIIESITEYASIVFGYVENAIDELRRSYGSVPPPADHL